MKNECNVFTFISIRLGFSIYAGWVNAATILNVSIFLKSVGLKDPDFFTTEETMGAIILYVAWIIYILTTVFNMNPVFGIVYIWVLTAIRAN